MTLFDRLEEVEEKIGPNIKPVPPTFRKHKSGKFGKVDLNFWKVQFEFPESRFEFPIFQLGKLEFQKWKMEIPETEIKLESWHSRNSFWNFQKVKEEFLEFLFYFLER